MTNLQVKTILWLIEIVLFYVLYCTQASLLCLVLLGGAFLISTEPIGSVFMDFIERLNDFLARFTKRNGE